MRKLKLIPYPRCGVCHGTDLSRTFGTDLKLFLVCLNPECGVEIETAWGVWESSPPELIRQEELARQDAVFLF